MGAEDIVKRALKDTENLMVNYNAMIIGLSALLNCEVAGMKAENEHRLSLGQSIAYDHEAFVSLKVANDLNCYLNDYVKYYDEMKDKTKKSSLEKEKKAFVEKQQYRKAPTGIFNDG